MKGFPIEIKNNLLDPKHIDKMGVAVWLYMWCIDKMTSISEEGIGKLLGGKPIKYAEVKEEIGVTERTYNRWLETLRKGDYIQTKKAPAGIIIEVNKAFKHFKKSYAESGISRTKNGRAAMPEVSEPIKTSQLDNDSMTSQVIKIGAVAPTPAEQMRMFCEEQPYRDLIASAFTGKGIPAEIVEREFKKFINYWTEPTKSGKRQRWELQPTFDIKRRLVTWFTNVKEKVGSRGREIIT